jgi:hypothetical protein
MPQKAQATFREADLYAPVRDFLIGKGYTVRSEVHHCDVAATRTRPSVSDGTGNLTSEELVVVELKKGLTIDLLVQGTKRQRDADLVYLAIPRPPKFWFNRKWRDLMHLLRRLELGLMLVNLISRDGDGDAPGIEVVLDPAPFDRAKSQASHKKQRAGLLKELKGRSHDGNIGGSTGVKLMTAYRERSLAIARALADQTGQSPAQLRTGPDDTKTATILRNNHYGWFVRLERGHYGLSASGRLAAEAANSEPLAAETPPAYLASVDRASRTRKPTKTSKPS